MARSTLDHGAETPPDRTKGHGTAALGPSDSSDSGSDIQGGPGLNRDDGLGMPAGTTSDPDVDGIGATAGADIGDADLDSDSDRFGTGERAAAGRDATLATDEVLRDIESDEVIDAEAIGDDADSVPATHDEFADSEGEHEDVEREAPGQPATGEDTDARERRAGREDGRGEVDDIPRFDRSSPEDLPRRRGDDTLH
jgi:hypothetical protein